MGKESESSRDACAVWDVGTDTDEAIFECLHCGWSEQSETNPGTCPECGNGLRNCSMPIE
jgi:rubrerythrin